MSLLGKIKKGKIDRPKRIMVYGEPGVGKTTFAAGFPSPLFIDAEKRSEHLDVERLEVNTWNEVKGAMREVLALEDCPYKTMVFDTVDHIEHMIHDHVISEAGVNSIEEVGGGYGKGYTESLEVWRTFILGLEKLRAKGIQCVLLAHGHVKTFRNPKGEDYDRWCLKMNLKAANFLREKMDALGFAHFEDFVSEKTGKANTTGDRIISFGHDPAYESKKGIEIEDSCPLSYDGFKEALGNKEKDNGKK